MKYQKNLKIQFCTVFVFFRDFLQLLKAWTSVWSYHKNQWLPQSGVFSGGCGGLMEPFGCLFMSYCALWGKTFVVRRKVWQHHWSNFAFATINTLCIAKGSMILICSRLLHNRASKVICLSGKNGILLPRLFWPTVGKNCFSDWENFLKFEAEGWKFWDH